MYSHHQRPLLDSLHHPNPRRRQPSSTSSTLLTPSEGSDIWMPNSTTVRGSSQTSRSIFSDGEQDEETNKGDEVTEVGTVDMPKIGEEFVLDEDEDQDRDRPLIDFGDDVPHSRSKRQVEESGPTPTPGDKLRILLRQMEAEVRNTTPAPTPVVVPTPYHARRPSDSNHQKDQRPYASDQESEAEYTPIQGPSRSHWREGRRIGALPKERSYSPVSSPERRTRAVSHEEQEEEEGEEVLDDSPPTPPLRITNPYLYNSRKVSDERRSQSPRISSRAAVLHASTSRSPPVPEAEPELRRPTALESYLARVPATAPSSAPGPSSPTRKGKERAITPTPTPPRQTPITTKGRGKTPRKWSVELAPDDSALFAEGIPVGQEGMELDIDIDESVEPPWAGIDTDTEGGEDESDDSHDVGVSGRTAIPRQTRSQSRSMEDGDELDLPELPEIQASFDESEEEQEVPPIARPSSRTRSRFSQSLSSSTSLRQPYPQPQSQAPKQMDRSPQKQSQSQSQSPSTSHSRSITQNQSVSFTTAKSTSPSFRLNRSTRPVKQVPVPPVQPIFPQEPVQVGMAFTPPISTPPRRGDISTPVPGQTPKPPGAWFSASKPAQVKFKTSPSPLRHSQEDHSGDTSIHRIKLSPARPPRHTEKEEAQEGEGDISITQRLVSLSKSLSFRPTSIPKPSTTLTEARLALAKAAEASAVAQMKVESTQRQWLEALGGMSGEKAVEVIRQSYSWGRWAWWISMEILLLWGVFRVTLEYAQMASNHPFDPSQGSTSLSLSVPLPTAISAFIIPGTRRGSVNFFDLLEGLEVWRVLGGEEGLGTGRRWVQVPT